VFPSLTGGLLRLDGLQLVLQIPLTGWRSVLWSWSANDDPGRLRTSNCNWIAPNVLVVTAESSLHFELAAPLPSAAQVQLEMRGGFLSLTDGSIRIEANAEGAAVSFHPM
jgi:hypothetical protein